MVCIASSIAYSQNSSGEGKFRGTGHSDAIMIQVNYNAQLPVGKLAERFGYTNAIGGGLGYKFTSNWQIGAEGAFLFGNSVKESSILDMISTSDGQHITINGNLTRVRLAQHGYNIKITGSKTIPVSKKFPDAGILLTTGVGLIQHKVYINVDENILPQLSKVYRRGYDRLTNGPAISQFIGGLWLAKRKFVSLYGGFQFDIAFTQNRRNWTFDKFQAERGLRYDMFVGFKLGWIIPIYSSTSDIDDF